MFDLKATTDAFLPLHCHATNINSVGAEEHREAAIAACLTHPYRSLAVLVSSYRKLIPCHKFDLNPSAPTESPAHSTTREQVTTHA
ncbi:hypothetical protein AUC61_02285 [Pseudomonas sp. S25]|uniref:Uncharacterized protein n=1 Tax=Pseudomonas maioricensis TaxID=1766623 RepID=A0ABS9ZFL0_9PSED|nr:hypothetical protein [Pseudomonas sp. S25]